MKILFLVPELFTNTGGIQQFNNHLLNALLELGHTLSIVSMNDTSQLPNLSTAHLLNFPTSQLLNFSPCARHRPIRKPLFIMETLKQVLSFKPDLILCGHVNFSPLCMVLSKSFKIPYFTLTYGVDVWNLNGLKPSGLKHSQGVITISNYTKWVMLEQLKNYPNDKISLLYPTFDSERFKPGPKPKYLMEKWEIKESDKVILTIARLSKSEKYKGYDKVILALSKLLNLSSSLLLNFSTSQLLNFKYILGGSGDDIDRIKGLIRENRLEDEVILTGFIPDEEIVDYYNLCDVFVMPSKGEGFGIVFLEALACGKPVIAGNKDGSVDAVLNGEVGILIDPDYIENIKKAIMDVCKGDVDKKYLDGSYLRSRVIEEYGFNKFKQKLESILGS